MLNLRANLKFGVHTLRICKRYRGYQGQPVREPQWLEDEYTPEPQYPEIKDLSLKARKNDEAKSWHETIGEVPTVEEKLIKINMPRYYGHKVVNLNDLKLPYNVLPAIQHYTRTLLEPMSTVNEQTEAGEEKVENPLMKTLENDVRDCIEFAHAMFNKDTDAVDLSPREKEYKLGQMIVEQINRVLTNTLSTEYTHLHDLEVDYNPRHEAFWCVGGIAPPKSVQKSKEGRVWQKEMKDEPVDRWIQYVGKPYLSLRHRLQLPAWKTTEEVTNIENAVKIPKFTYDPRTLGYNTGNVHVTNIPGFWPQPAKSHAFGFLNYCPRHCLLERSVSPDYEDLTEVLQAQGIQASYAWLLALASYNGFNTFNDLTYPMTTQTIVTNGRNWSFFEYQLNTLLLHSENVDNNPKANFCRNSPDMQLYVEVDEKGKCVGFNNQVLEYLIKFYKNKPSVEMSERELRPYLDEKYQLIADYSDEEKRVFLEKAFKHMVSNRPRHLELPEIYLWEKIYKIDHNTRPMDARRRFFELDINPWKRTLDQHQKEYIPRCKRANGPKDKKNKWIKTHYP